MNITEKMAYDALKSYANNYSDWNMGGAITSLANKTNVNFAMLKLVMRACTDIGEKRISEPAFRVLCVLYKFYYLNLNDMSNPFLLTLEFNNLMQLMPTFTREKLEKCIYALKMCGYIREYSHVQLRDGDFLQVKFELGVEPISDIYDDGQWLISE